MNQPYKISSFLLPFLKKHIVIVVLLIMIVICSVISTLLPSYALKFLIDSIVNSQGTSNNIILNSCLFFGSYFLVALFTMLQNYMIDIYGQKLIHELRYQMIEKSHRMTYAYFTHHGTGEMTSRIIDDVQAVETLFASGLISFVVSFFKIIGILISVFVFSWPLGLILMAVIPVIYFLTKFFRKRMLNYQMKNRKQLNALTNDISETSQNMQVIQLLGKEQYQEEKYQQILKALNQTKQKTALFDSIYSPIVDSIKAIFIGSVTLLVSYASETTSVISLGITVGTFAAALDLISNIFVPIINLGQEMETMQEGISGLKRVEVFMSEKEITSKDNSILAKEVLKKEELIRVENLSFHYDDSEEDVIKDVSFSLKKKDKVTLIGRTGAGKTTLFRLLTGILEPTTGDIFIGDYKANRIPEQQKKYLFGYVEQGFSAIPGTVLDQITLHDKSISIEQVEKVMDRVFLNDYVLTEVKGGYQAEFRMDLFSRGQLQLLSLARALVFDPEILLLDEISANLDAKTEGEIIAILSDPTMDKTIISISHRLSDQLNFNKILEVNHEGVTLHCKENQ